MPVTTSAWLSLARSYLEEGNEDASWRCLLRFYAETPDLLPSVR
jgi:hypothetical protein